VTHQVFQAGDPWPYSHRVKNSRTPERRYDQIYVTNGFTVASCRYRHDWQDRDPSDHAAVEAELRFDRSSRGNLRQKLRRPRYWAQWAVAARSGSPSGPVDCGGGLHIGGIIVGVSYGGGD
jgi:hypothetical protein